jgi:hypothetical protein
MKIYNIHISPSQYEASKCWIEHITVKNVYQGEERSLRLLEVLQENANIKVLV